MSGRANRDRIRRDVQPRVAELRARLIEWDVLAVYQDDEGPDDHNEYVDLIAPILGWLGDDVDATELSVRLVQFLRRAYGLEYEDDEAELPFARSLVDWWRSKAS